jgi:hypothetical protein
LGSGKRGTRGAAILIHPKAGESDIFRSTRDSVEILLGHRARKTNLKESRNILETGSCKKILAIQRKRLYIPGRFNKSYCRSSKTRPGAQKYTLPDIRQDFVRF